MFPLWYVTIADGGFKKDLSLRIRCACHPYVEGS